MKKVLLTGLGDKLGGTESFIRVLVEGLAEEYDFSVLAATNQQYAMADFFRARHVSVYQLHGIFGLKSTLSRGKILEKFFQEHHFDVVHVNANTINAAYIARAAVDAGIKVIFQIHNATPSGYSGLARILTRLNTPYQRRFLQRAGVPLVAVSQEAAVQVFGSKLIHRCQIIENGINTVRFRYDFCRRKAVRNELNIDLDARVAVTISRLMPIKNIDRAIRIFTGAFGEQLDYLVIVGEGPEQAHLKDVASEYPSAIKNRILFVGQQDNPEDYLMASDVFFALSTAEGLSISVIEAEAAGLPVLASTGVPAITNITNRVQYVPLTAKDEVWLNHLTPLMPSTAFANDSLRLADNDTVRASRFSEQTFLKRFRDLYH